MPTRIFTERLDLSSSRLDPDNQIIYGVILIRAGMSKNRRFYSEDVLRAAAPIFDNAKAYLNHDVGARSAVSATSSPRSLRDLAGWYANVNYRDGALYADRYFTRTAAGQDAWAIAEDIVTGRAPATLAGLSINAVGQGDSQDFPDGEAFNVECITHALSVDDVSDAAAGGAYVSDEQPLVASSDSLTHHLLAALSYEEWTNARPDFIRRLRDEMKTVRQEEALTASRSETENAVNALIELQESFALVQAERDIALRERDIQRLLAEARVPGAWLTALQAQLLGLTAVDDAWFDAACALIALEEAKARAAGFQRGANAATADVEVKSAPQRIYNAPAPPSLVPLPDMNRLRSPEDLAALVRQFQSK